MSVRGSRFLPAEGLQLVAIDYVCSVCAKGGTRTRMLRHQVTTTHERFEDERTSFAGADAVEEQRLDDGRWRYKLTCKRCGHERPIRGERLDAALRAVYEPGRRAVIEYEV